MTDLRGLTAALLTVFVADCGGQGVATDPLEQLGGPAPSVGLDGAETTGTAQPPQTGARGATASALPSRVTMAAVGDIMLGRSVATMITADDPAGPFANVRGILESADITTGNLETAITSRGSPEPKAYTFRSPPLAARGLALAGFDVVALANNHSLDYGADGLADTQRLLAAEGIRPVGAGTSRKEAYAASFLERGGRRFAFLAFAEVPPEGAYDVRSWRADGNRPGIAWLEDGPLTEAVAAASQEADIVVVMLHFGFEGSPDPSPRQQVIAHTAIDAGAAVVLGSHPHVLQRVEEYRGGLIAYSLGNFVFDGFDGEANQTGILRLAFETDGRITWELRSATIGPAGRPSLEP